MLYSVDFHRYFNIDSFIPKVLKKHTSGKLTYCQFTANAII